MRKEKMIHTKVLIASISLLLIDATTCFLQHSVAPQSRHGVSTSSSTISHPPGRRAYVSKLQSTIEQDRQLYEDFLIDKKKRELIYNTPLTKNLDGLDQEYLIQKLTAHTFQNGDFVIRQGHDGNDMYFTEDGSLAAITELFSGEPKILTKYDRQHQLLGEMSLLTGQTRAASIVVTSDSATLFRLSKEDFEKVMSKNDAVNLLKKNTSYVAKYVELCKKKELLQNCPVFADLSESDLERVACRLELQSVAEGSRFISEGDSGDTMYFVEKGKFRFDIGGKMIDCKECGGEGNFFGELALFLDQPRAADVTALEESSVWVLRRDDFLDAIEESAIDKKALELLLEKYRSTSTKKGRLGILVQLRPGDLREIMVHKSRPKKKSVSFHAMCCLFALGSFVSTLLPLFAPGRDALGLPRIWDVNGFQELSRLRQFQVSSWLMTISGLMGLLRIPKRAPQSKKLLFGQAALGGLFMSLYVTSNLTGTHAALFNAFRFPFNFLVAVPAVRFWFRTLALIDDAVAGPMDGRHTLPLAATRGSSILTSIVISLLSLFFVPISLPVFASNLQSYEANCSIFIRSGAEGSQLSTLVLTQAAAWLASFFATLLYEKKMKSSTASLWCGAIMFLLLFDPTLLAFAGLLAPKRIIGGETMLAYFGGIVRKFAVRKIAYGCIAATILNGVRKNLRPKVKPT